MSKTTESLRWKLAYIVYGDASYIEEPSSTLDALESLIQAELASARRESNEEGFKKGIGLAKEFALVALKEYLNRQTPEQEAK